MKMHKQVMRGMVFTKCGMHIDRGMKNGKIVITEKWGRVTCERCLKTK